MAKMPWVGSQGGQWQHAATAWPSRRLHAQQQFSEAVLWLCAHVHQAAGDLPPAMRQLGPHPLEETDVGSRSTERGPAQDGELLDDVQP